MQQAPQSACFQHYVCRVVVGPQDTPSTYKRCALRTGSRIENFHFMKETTLIIGDQSYEHKGFDLSVTNASTERNNISTWLKQQVGWPPRSLCATGPVQTADQNRDGSPQCTYPVGFSPHGGSMKQHASNTVWDKLGGHYKRIYLRSTSNGR